MERDLSIKGQTGNRNIGHYGRNRTNEKNNPRMRHTNIVEISQNITNLLQNLGPMSKAAQCLLYIMVTLEKRGINFFYIAKPVVR